MVNGVATKARVGGARVAASEARVEVVTAKVGAARGMGAGQTEKEAAPIGWAVEVRAAVNKAAAEREWVVAAMAKEVAKTAQG